MNTSNIATFGSWESPITSDLIVSQTIDIGGIIIDSQNVYWLEKRPQEKGRNVIVGYFGGEGRQIKSITPSPLSVRSKIHEYGGGAYTVSNNTVYFSNYGDGRIYQQAINQKPQPLTNKLHQRYADIVLEHGRNRLICVCEDHQNQNSEAKNSLISIDLTTGKIKTLVDGDDFYSSPRLSPDGNHLAWLSWNHPYMPWDSTYLWLAQLNQDGTIGSRELVAGGEAESVCEPKWSSDGELFFSSDRTNWWNLYRRQKDGSVEILHQMAAEFAYPHWVFGLSTYGFVGNDRIVCTYSSNGSWHLGVIDLKTKQFDKIITRYTNISDLQASESGFVVFVGGTPTETTAVIKIDLDSKKEQILKRSGDLTIDPDYLALPEAISFPTADDLTAHAWYYPPTNKDYIALPGELPPLIVKSHGGPTAAASVDLNLRIQYWTSRGFGYLDVNYGGSIGYGSSISPKTRW